MCGRARHLAGSMVGMRTVAEHADELQHAVPDDHEQHQRLRQNADVVAELVVAVQAHGDEALERHDSSCGKHGTPPHSVSAYYTRQASGAKVCHAPESGSSPAMRMTQLKSSMGL